MLETEIKALTAAVEALTAVMVAAQPAKADEPKAKVEKSETDRPKADAPKEEKPMITMDDLTRMCLGLARDGHRDVIKEKLSALNVGRVGELSGEGFNDFAEWAVALAERAEPSA